MAIDRDAIQYALTLLKQGRLRLHELCKVMAVYGARRLRGEVRFTDGIASSEAVDLIVSEVLRGGYPTAHDVSGTPAASAAYFEDNDSWHDVDKAPSFHDDATDLGAATSGGLLRRLSRMPAEATGSSPAFASTLTPLARFYEEHDIQPTVSPGLDADGPPPDAQGIGQYALGHSIGKGGAGNVLHGVDRDLRRSVAVKVLHDQHRSNPLLLRAFFEEAIITGGLEHPNIVPVYQLGYHADIGPYYVMKRLDGLTLGNALQGLRKHDPEMEARFDLDRLLTIFVEVCQAIVYAHDRRVIHCDLKPNNILIGHYGEVMVVDWGLAYVMGEEGVLQARSQFWSGTPGFMAPEQVIGDVTAYDQRTDVWALGGLLYAMLCLARPFVGKTKQETLHRVLNAQLSLPSKRNPSRRIPEFLETVCLKAMAKAKEDRFQSVTELMSAIEDHLAGRRRLRQRVELAQKALADMRTHLDALSGTEAVVDALQRRLMAAAQPNDAWRRDLQELREEMALAYKAASEIGVEALEAGAHHPALTAAIGELYWSVFRRLYPARVPANRQIQRLATEMLRCIGEVALPAVVQEGRRLAGLGADAPLADLDLTEDAEDPWLKAVLAYCGPDASAPDAETEGVAAEMGRRLAFLKDVPLFQAVPGMELLPIAAACELRTFRAQTPMFNEGDFGDSLYIVVDGVVNVVLGTAVINTVGARGVLGEIAIIDGATRTAAAVCATDVVVYRLSAGKFREIVRSNGTIGLAVMRVLTSRLREASAREDALRDS